MSARWIFRGKLNGEGKTGLGRKRYFNPTELTAEMLNKLIEKIVIHEATKEPNGTRTQEIEIFTDSWVKLIKTHTHVFKFVKRKGVQGWGILK